MHIICQSAIYQIYVHCTGMYDQLFRFEFLVRVVLISDACHGALSVPIATSSKSRIKRLRMRSKLITNDAFQSRFKFKSILK